METSSTLAEKTEKTPTGTESEMKYPIILFPNKIEPSKEKKISIFPGPLDENQADYKIIEAFHGYNRLRATVENRPGYYIVKNMQIVFESTLLSMLYCEISFGLHNNVGYSEFQTTCGFSQIESVKPLNSYNSMVTIPMNLELHYNNIQEPTEMDKKLLSENNSTKRLDSFIDITMHNCSIIPIYIILNMERKTATGEEADKTVVTTLNIGIPAEK